ncbi:GNAT family N-acetyltransferase [candidate division WOR-3 bacterium]|nr:GNAT family N-acetyltransferase [candidate division WOR-3 bacterium]
MLSGTMARAGIVTSAVYGDYAFLGNLIVRRDLRAQGTGLLLMEAAIAGLDQRGIKTIELDGVFKAVDAYRLLGFKDKYLSLRFARPAAPGLDHGGMQPDCRAVDIGEILRFDRDQVGFDRSAFLEHLLKLHPGTTFCVGRHALSAYGVTRVRATGVVHIGPLVAESAEAASFLLALVCRVHADRDLTIGSPGINAAAIEAVLEQGFLHRRPSLRMWRGRRIAYERGVYAIVSADAG